MGPTSPAVSRRGIITAITAGSVLALATSAAAEAEAGAGTQAAAALIDRDRLGAAVTKTPDGKPVNLHYTPDFHERLSDWMRFWWANAPASWIAPFEVHTAGTTSSGQAFLLTGIAYTRAGRLHSGFDAGKRDAAYWATIASLYHFFGSVTLAGDRVRVADGHPGFNGSPEQTAFTRSALAEVWHDGQGAGDITSLNGWKTFTRATLRLGLGTHL